MAEKRNIFLRFAPLIGFFAGGCLFPCLLFIFCVGVLHDRGGILIYPMAGILAAPIGLIVGFVIRGSDESSSGPSGVQRPSDRELQGMTVNERLVACGVIESWDDAVRKRNRDEMLAVLRGVAMTENQAIDTVDSVLKNPRTYGF